MSSSDVFVSRRRVIAASAFAAGGFILARRPGLAQDAAPTPACHDGDEPTMAETEGPFFKPRSPQRSDLREPGVGGRPIELSGFVLTRGCRPVAGALVDLWQADDRGEYDTKGFRLRGHVFTDDAGRYVFHTIVPGLYPGRTRHYHVKAQAPHQRVLTTQFYFPDESRNRTDPLFRRELTMQVGAADDVMRARFDVVLAI
jgi:protocatechuate 3,4-dioxygenase beta subunit